MGTPAGRVQLRYRRADGKFADTTLERVVVDDLVAGLPVREFRWYKGRRHYSGWYWSSTMGRLVAYESRLELARVMLADRNQDVFVKRCGKISVDGVSVTLRAMNAAAESFPAVGDGRA